MKKITFLMLILASLTLNSLAQDISTKNREIGLSLNGPYAFGLRYKIGEENTRFRLTLLSMNGVNRTNKNDLNQTKSSSLGFALNFGFEKRKSITERLCFYAGSDLLVSYGTNHYKYLSTSSSTDWTISPGIGLVLGFNYKISDDFNISAEVVPSIAYSYVEYTSVNGDIKSIQIEKRINYGFTNSVGNVTISFKLGKKS